MEKVAVRAIPKDQINESITMLATSALELHNCCMS